MKWKYAVTYAKMKPGWTLEQLEKDMAKYKAEVEKKGLKLVFWGHPFGVSENIFVVIDVEGHMEDYANTAGSVPSPMTDSRTDLVMVH